MMMKHFVILNCQENQVSSIRKKPIKPSGGDMREVDMKCKVAPRLLPSLLSDSLVQAASLLHFPALADRLTRSRKLTAEDAFCCQFLAHMHRLRLSARSNFFPNAQNFRDDSKNEGRKLAAENFVGRNDQK
jgi:hypothetical protein